jgi:hypothetical protein
VEGRLLPSCPWFSLSASRTYSRTSIAGLAEEFGDEDTARTVLEADPSLVSHPRAGSTKSHLHCE